MQPSSRGVLNTQEPLSVDRNQDGTVLVHHVFYTIQGEGPFAGTPAVFVRLFGCNIQCPMCDTDYMSRRQKMRPAEVAAEVRHAIPSTMWDRVKDPLVIITGGEPFRQNIGPLVGYLAHCGYRVQIETNGTLWLPDFPYNRCTIVCSPKTTRINQTLAAHAHAFKYVIEYGYVCPTDGLPTHTLGHYTDRDVAVARPPTSRKDGYEVYVQPLDTQDAERNKLNTQATVASAMRHGYRLCIQTHKLVNLE